MQILKCREVSFSSFILKYIGSINCPNICFLLPTKHCDTDKLSIDQHEKTQSSFSVDIIS